MQQPTLIILAAGMGSRYGSLKQIDRFGPSGETIVEYSIYDALRAGFEKIVLVIRRNFEDDFREIVLNKAMKKADISFVFQELDNLPSGFSLSPGRVKPWGTGHAVLMAADKVNTPFAVVNADDFYGAQSYRIMTGFLSQTRKNFPEEYCLVDYRLDNTLSESGFVSRGICNVDKDNYLTDITEHKKISRNGNEISSLTESGKIILSGKERVSMNLMGFLPSMFDHLRKQFTTFLTINQENKDAEFFLPTAMNQVIKSGEARVKVLPTTEKWFGVTYREDRDMVMNSLKRLVDQGVYPHSLWE
jgi:UTP-glucose-1-phosphate uridylyltransferase